MAQATRPSAPGRKPRFTVLHYMPKTALAGLLLITAARLIDRKRLRYTIGASRYDAGLVIITALTGVLIDLDTPCCSVSACRSCCLCRARQS